MSHYLADLTESSISKVATKGFVLATKLKAGKSIEVNIDSSDDYGRYTSIKTIKKVAVTPSGKLVHIDVGADEPIEVRPTDYIKYS